MYIRNIDKEEKMNRWKIENNVETAGDIISDKTAIVQTIIQGLFGCYSVVIVPISSTLDLGIGCGRAVKIEF
jgi:hypothetical protein